MILTTLRLGSLVVGLALASLAPPAAAVPQTPTLTSVTARHVGSVDRVTFRFDHGLPAKVYPQWVDRLAYDGSGLPVRVAGTKVLQVGFTSATAHDDDGLTAAKRTAYALPNVITSVYGGDFEGYVSIGLGVQKRTSYTVTRLSDRIVVDVRADFPTTSRKVWLVDTQANVVPRSRPVPVDAPAAGALHALFAGPTPQERAAGLRLVRSGAWGFDGLSVVDGIARLRLTRHCNSGGSTTTVASEIFPTLRQFPSVDWVKILAPNGTTEQPTGDVDSIPACLEP